MIKLKPILHEIRIINKNNITLEKVKDLFDYIPLLGSGDESCRDYENIKSKYFEKYLKPKNILPQAGGDIARLLPKEGLVEFYLDILKFCNKYGFIK